MTDTKPEQPASILAQIGTTLLSSYKVLALVRRTPFHQPLNLSDLREAVYLGYLPWSARLPDHVFEHSWQLLAQQSASKNSTGILTGALGVMADEFLEPRHGNLHVKQQKFGAWQQSIVSRMSGIPLLAAAHSSVRPHAWLATETHTQWPWEPPRSWASKNLPVISPYDPLVDTCGKLLVTRPSQAQARGKGLQRKVAHPQRGRSRFGTRVDAIHRPGPFTG